MPFHEGYRGTKQYSKGDCSSEVVPLGGTGWYRWTDHSTPVPLGPLLGTTLTVHFPFEYHRYYQYPVSNHEPVREPTEFR